MFYKIRFFDSLGHNYPPGSLPMARGAYFGNVLQNKKKFVVSNVEDNRLISVYAGGVIVLPAGFADTVLEISKISSFIQTVSEEIIKQGCKNGSFSEAFTKLTMSIGLSNFAEKTLFVGCLFRGKYISVRKTVFDESSTAVEFRGVPLKILFLVATLICKEFEQEEVIIKCFDNETIYMVNPLDFRIKTIANLLKYSDLEVSALDYADTFFGYINYDWKKRFFKWKTLWNERKGGH